MGTECPICLDVLKIPVKFTAFKCPQKIGSPNCHSITRVCLSCARDYLQLNTPRSQRDLRKKCLLCPSSVELKTLNAYNSYEKDFRMMAMDIKNDYECVHVSHGCHFQGTQNELDRHLQHECLFRYIFCDCCRQSYIAHDKKKHIETCIGYTSCQYCYEILKKEYMDQHIYQKHMKCICYTCLDHFDICVIDSHMKICPEKYLKCEECQLNVKNKDIKSHYEKHIQTYQEKIMKCEKQILNIFYLP